MSTQAGRSRACGRASPRPGPPPVARRSGRQYSGGSPAQLRWVSRRGGKDAGRFRGRALPLAEYREIRQLLHQDSLPKKLRPRILIANSYYYLTVSGVLHQMGLRVPEDISDRRFRSPRCLLKCRKRSHYDFSHETPLCKLSQR